jgi:transposase
MAKRHKAKRRVLQEQGTLNPDPAAVHDTLFCTHEFFDPRDLVQVKYEMLRRARLEGQTVTEAASAFGFSRLSFYHVQAAWKREGLGGLVPKKRGPKGPHKLTEEIMVFLTQARIDDPSASSAQLARRVQQAYALRIHPRTIERALARREKKRKRPA